MKKLVAQPVANAIQFQIKDRVQHLLQKRGRAPKLSVVLVGEDPASVIYTQKKGEMAASLGMQHETLRLPATVSPEAVKELVDQLNCDPSVDGVLIQRPLPSQFKEEEVLYWISPEKDVDAFHPTNAGKLFLGIPGFQPCTPAGVMALLKYYQIEVSGRTACVVGRSPIVGKPMGSLLLQADATVIHCHSKSENLAHYTLQADILVVAAGKIGLIQAKHVQKDAVVIDVGMHRDLKGKLVGDVAFNDVASKVAAITPVPGGVGPMTIAMLMQNTLLAAEQKLEKC